MISIISSPNYLEPVYQNSIPWVVQSTLATASNFRYTFETFTGEIYSDVTNFQSFNSTYPRFNDDCIFSPHLILKSVLDYNLTPFMDTGFMPATQSYSYYQIKFGEQYNPNLRFFNTFPYVGLSPSTLILFFTQSNNFDIQIGDQIKIDKTDKSVNPQYDGYTSVIDVGTTSLYTPWVYYVRTDTQFGQFPMIGTISIPETGFITDLSRTSTQSSTFSVFSGVKQYEETCKDFSQYLINLEPVQFNSNPYFIDSTNWVLTNYLGATATISSGLNYIDSTSNGFSTIVQNNILEAGLEYNVQINVSNNNFCLIEVGDQFNTYTICNNQNGTFNLSFIASGTNFFLIINSAGGITQGCDITECVVSGQFLTQNKYLSVWPQNKRKGIYFGLTGSDSGLDGRLYYEYETLSFMVGPEEPNFYYDGFSNLAYRVNSYDESNSLVYTERVEIDPTWSGLTPRYDYPIGTNQLYLLNDYLGLTPSCGWKYDTYLEGPDRKNIILNPLFTSTASWILGSYSNGNIFISPTGGPGGAGLLEFETAVEFGGTGFGLAEQSNILTIGMTYCVSINVLNNVNTTISIGDDLVQYPIVDVNSTGNYQYCFVANSTNFQSVIASTDSFAFGAQIESIYVTEAMTASRISEIRSYEIKCQCREYELIRLAFVNKLGGVDYFTFNLVSKFKSNINRDLIKKTLRYNYGVGNRADKVVNQNIFETWTVNTDWLDDEEALFIRELIESPEVYWLKYNEDCSKYQMIPVIISDNQYDYRSTLNDYEIQYTINFQLSYDILSNV